MNSGGLLPSKDFTTKNLGLFVFWEYWDYLKGGFKKVLFFGGWKGVRDWGLGEFFELIFFCFFVVVVVFLFLFVG